MKVEGASLLARATLGLVLVAGIVACGGEVASNEFVGTWIEAGTERTVTFADEGAFSTSDGGAGTWSTDVGHLVLEVASGTFQHGDAAAPAGYRTSGPYRIEADRLMYLESTYERTSTRADPP